MSLSLPMNDNDEYNTYTICNCDNCIECSGCFLGTCDECKDRDEYIIQEYKEHGTDSVELKFTGYTILNPDITGEYHIKFKINEDFSSEIECFDDICEIDEETPGYIISNIVNDEINLKLRVHMNSILKLIDLHLEYSDNIN